MKFLYFFTSASYGVPANLNPFKAGIYICCLAKGVDVSEGFKVQNKQRLLGNVFRCFERNV